MKKHITDAKTGIAYTLHGEYYLPNCSLPAEEEIPIGVWGAGPRWGPLPQAEAPTEAAAETNDTNSF